MSNQLTKFNPQNVLNANAIKTIKTKDDAILAIATLGAVDEKSTKMRAMYALQMLKVLPEGEKVEDVLKEAFNIGYSSSRNMLKVAASLLTDKCVSVFAEYENGEIIRDFSYKQLTALIPRGKGENAFTVEIAKKWLAEGIISYTTKYDELNALVKEYINPTISAELENVEESTPDSVKTTDINELNDFIALVSEKWETLTEETRKHLFDTVSKA